MSTLQCPRSRELAAFLVTAGAANSHGDAVSDLAKASKALVGEARGDVISALAKTNGRSHRTKTAATERDGQGDAVSAIARSDATAAHSTGDKTVNHGGAVSAAAHAK